MWPLSSSCIHSVDWRRGAGTTQGGGPGLCLLNQSNEEGSTHQLSLKSRPLCHSQSSSVDPGAGLSATVLDLGFLFQIRVHVCVWLRDAPFNSEILAYKEYATCLLKKGNLRALIFCSPVVCRVTECLWSAWLGWAPSVLWSSQSSVLV